MKSERIGDLESLIKRGLSEKKCVVLFHGFGADAGDLAPLANFLDPTGEYSWIFPNGFMQVPVGPGFFGKAWFQIDVAALEKAMTTGVPRDLRDWEPKNLDRALAKALSLLEVVQDQYSEVIVGGFSQGAMLATEVTLNSAFSPSALVLLSTSPLHMGLWSEKIKYKSPIPFFQSHGRDDQVLSFKGAQQVYDLLRAAGWPGELNSFKGGHEIPPQVLNSLRQFLRPIQGQ